MRKTFVDELTVLANVDERIYTLAANMGYGVFDEFEKQFSNRYSDVGIAENLMMGTAAGLATTGKQVWVYSFAPFVTGRPFETVRDTICFHNLDVKIISTASGMSYGPLGFSHHATEDIALMRSLPNMHVISPADPIETSAAIKFANQFTGPVYIRLQRSGDPNFNTSQDIDITKPIELPGYGNDVTIIGTGAIVEEGLKAAEVLQEQGVNTTVFSVPMIKPLPATKLLEIISKSKILVSVEEHQLNGGFTSAISELINDNLDKLPVGFKHIRIGINDEFTSIVGGHSYLKGQYKVDSNAIVEKVLELRGGGGVTTI
jgi:transketolase